MFGDVKITFKSIMPCFWFPKHPIYYFYWKFGIFQRVLIYSMTPSNREVPENQTNMDALYLPESFKVIRCKFIVYRSIFSMHHIFKPHTTNSCNRTTWDLLIWTNSGNQSITNVECSPCVLHFKIPMWAACHFLPDCPCSCGTKNHGRGH